MKKIMIWCSLLSLVLLKLFAIYKGVKFVFFPKSYDIITFVMVGSGTYIVYLLYKIGKKKKSLYNIFLIGCIIGMDGFSEGSLEKTLHTLGMISLLIFIVSFFSLKKNIINNIKKF